MVFIHGKMINSTPGGIAMHICGMIVGDGYIMASLRFAWKVSKGPLPAPSI